jgi:threonine dehydratase
MRTVDPSSESADVLFRRVLAAAGRLRGKARITPVVTSRTLDRHVGAEVFLKCENFQRTGAFKFRGAWNAMSQLSDAERTRGVLTYSSGNHGQAIALAGNLLKVPTTVIMPTDAPAIKRAATKDYGARVVEYHPERDSREELARRLSASHGYAVIPPFDHIDVIAGQGTAALELADRQAKLDMLLVPCGGGGLLSGCAVAVKFRHPACRVVGVEPEAADDATRSYRSGKLQTVHHPLTIADGTRTPSLGKLTFPLIQRLVDDMVTVTENAILAAVKFSFYRLKIVIEPSGVLGMAALLSGAVAPRGRVGVIISGGNIDGPTMQHILS